MELVDCVLIVADRLWNYCRSP